MKVVGQLMEVLPFNEYKTDSMSSDCLLVQTHIDLLIWFTNPHSMCGSTVKLLFYLI